MVNNRRFETEEKDSVFGRRHLQCFLLFCGLCVAFGTRVNLSVAIVAMTDHNSTNTKHMTFDWDEKKKSYILSSFFWGYFITQIPGGHLAQKFGGKSLALFAIFSSSICTLFTPLSAKLGDWQFVCAVRFLEGLSQGVFFPSIHTILAKWSPVTERGTLGTFCYTGSQGGTVAVLAVSGFLAASKYGWPSIFYVSGSVGLIWSLAWIIWGASSPSECKTITEKERILIESSFGDTMHKGDGHLKTPWLKIFTSPAFLVLIIVHCGHTWGYWTLLTQIPTYMKHILGLDIKKNALLSTLPYVAKLILGFVFCYISNVLEKHQCIRLVTIRKLFCTISQWIPMVTIVALGYVSAVHIDLIVVLLTLTVGLNAASFLGWHMNHIDLSPNFTGVLMGITNCAANIMSFVAPLVVGLVVSDEKNPDQWRIIFFIAGGFYFIGNLLFIILGSAKVQPWNDPPVKNHEHKFSRVETTPMNMQT